MSRRRARHSERLTTMVRGGLVLTTANSALAAATAAIFATASGTAMPMEAPIPSATTSGVEYETLREQHSAGADWPTFAGSYNGHRHSSLTQISTETVTQLEMRWQTPIARGGSILEATPIVVGRRMFVTDSAGGVIALDAQTGRQLWKFTRHAPDDALLCCGVINRGAAVLGNRVYVATIDAHLVALDATDGRVVWSVQVADYRNGYSSTGAPLAVKDLIVTGIAGSEFRTRGFIAAFDARTGALRWKTHTVPAPGEPGNETWKGDSWRTGGAPTWMTGSFDPELDLIFWGTGNPAPDYDASLRRGDNLYSTSLLALDAETGRLAWHFQYTPADDHDWDAVQVPVLVDLHERGAERKLALVANRNGFFYALERTTGRFLRASPFVRQTWARGISRTGRPIRRLDASPTPEGVLVYPGRVGGTNWWPPAYDPQAELFLVPALERGGIFFKREVDKRRDKPFLAGMGMDAPGPFHVAVRAIDPRTGKRRWEYRSEPRTSDARLCGLLSTAGGLVFGGDQTRLFALDVRSGKLLWSFDTDGAIYAPPITYVVGEEQFIAIATGNRVVAWALQRPEPS